MEQVTLNKETYDQMVIEVKQGRERQNQLTKDLEGELSALKAGLHEITTYNGYGRAVTYVTTEEMAKVIQSAKDDAESYKKAAKSYESVLEAIKNRNLFERIFNKFV